MDWFERLTGFRESSYAETQARLAVEGRQLVSRVNGQSYGIGELTTPSLNDLRERVRARPRMQGHPRLGLVQGDARELHRRPEFHGALFQVASQFNLLEMIGPDVTPEQGVTRYASDHTQGPACAIAAGAATIFRNYFAPVGDGIGQTASRQIDALADVGRALQSATGEPKLWEMRNGYAHCTSDGLAKIGRHLRSLDEQGLDALRGRLRIGLHSDVEVTDATQAPRPVVSQAFCAALPVAYFAGSQALWAPFARLVLEAAYEATLLAGALNAARGASDIVLLTMVGGGAFGNAESWIIDAIHRALGAVEGVPLDVRIVSYADPSPALRKLIASTLR